MTQEPPPVRLPTRLFVSSGDLLADRRYEMARAYRMEGDLVVAADLLEQLVERMPGFTAAWFDLGDVREQAGDRDGAIAAFRVAATADPADRHGAAMRLALIEATQTAMSADYVRAVFDQYAPIFDVSLAALSYSGPHLLLQAVAQLCSAQGRTMQFPRMLDLGCGTGLAGAAFRPHVGWMAGVDLSGRMIAQARHKALYDTLEVADLSEAMATRAAEGDRADLIVAADVLIYCADLYPVMARAADVLAIGGLFAFTVETHPGEGVRLGPKLRYAQSETYVRQALEAAGLVALQCGEMTIRTESGLPVSGLVLIAASAAPSSLA
jgi:predicted TPR repeat methyltransferase